MKRPLAALLIAWAAVGLVCYAASTSAAEEPQGKPTTIEVGDYQMTVPAEFQRQQPKSRIIEHEFAAPAAQGDEQEGRLTIMHAGGSVADNIERWYGQFSQPDGASTKERAKVEKKTIAGTQVHLVDLSGTFKDQRGPFAPAVEREKYRMLGAIIEAEGPDIFLKFTGPEKTVASHEKAFEKMVQSLRKQ